MNRESYKNYELDESREKRLWDEAIFVFDTSALIYFYYYPKITRDEIFRNIFAPIKDRLWIPFHVQFEYLKNRKKIIEKLIVEKYNPIKKDKIHKIKSASSQIKGVSQQIKKDTQNPEKHPHLPQEKIDEFIEFSEELNKKVEDFENYLISEIEKQEVEIKSLSEEDTILEEFENLIEVGEELPFKKIMEIVKEGKMRYEFKIPPGYMDQKEKEGIQMFGDLIIWKQILHYSKSNSKSVIFICNDLKNDWCYKDSRNRIKSPREELVKEFYDNSGKEFWMYDQSQFLYKSNKYLKTKIEDSKIEEVSRVIDEKNRNNLIFKCGYCRHTNIVPDEKLYYDFECVGSSERNMGEENEYQSIEQLECENCGNEIVVKFEIWEYPVGVHNYDEIGIDHGQIIQNPNFVDKFWDTYRRNEYLSNLDEHEFD